MITSFPQTNQNLNTSSLQVVERVTVFVMDANDEKPEFQNMPAIIDVLEVSRAKHVSNKMVKTYYYKILL